MGFLAPLKNGCLFALETLYLGRNFALGLIPSERFSYTDGKNLGAAHKRLTFNYHPYASEAK